MEENMLSSELFENYENSLISKNDARLPKGFKFSKGFEERMQKITGSPRIHIRKRLKLAFMAAAILSIGFLLGMAAKPKWGYTTRQVDEGIYLTFDVSTIKDPKKSIEEKYTLAGIPEGLELDDQSWLNTDYLYSEAWCTFDGKGNGHIDVYFGQYIPAAYRNIYISDKDEKYLVTEENSIQYFIVTPDDKDKSFTSVIWYQDGYVFLVDANMNKDETINLCKTLKLRDN